MASRQTVAAGQRLNETTVDRFFRRGPAGTHPLRAFRKVFCFLDSTRYTAVRILQLSRTRSVSVFCLTRSLHITVPSTKWAYALGSTAQVH